MGTGQSLKETARKLGLRFRVVPKLALEDGIQAVRNILPVSWFDETGCQEGLEHLEGYQREYDEKLKIFKKTPRHDEHSHAADAIRTGALGKRWAHNYVGAPRVETDFRVFESLETQVADTDFDVFADI
jgi:hypothetical protein